MARIKNMTNSETREYLLKWCGKPYPATFAWPTDRCGYDQHIKFVSYRNKNWKGGSIEEFNQFVRDYAMSLPE